MPDRDRESDNSELARQINWIQVSSGNSQSFATKPRSRIIQALEYSDDSLTMRNG